MTDRITDPIRLQLTKPNGEIYVFIYHNDQRSQCMRTLGRFASNQELSFSWFDAAMLSARVRQIAKEAVSQ